MFGMLVMGLGNCYCWIGGLGDLVDGGVVVVEVEIIGV